MNFKRLITSKTFWTGLGTIAVGIFQIVEGDTATGIQTISIGAGMVFLRDAISHN